MYSNNTEVDCCRQQLGGRDVSDTATVVRAAELSLTMSTSTDDER